MYLWLVVPFIQRAETIIADKTTISDHFWPIEMDNKKRSTPKRSKEIRKVAEESLSQSNGMGVASYREIAIAISRKWARDMPIHGDDGKEPEMDAEEEAADQQASHSSNVAGMVYARESSKVNPNLNPDRDTSEVGIAKSGWLFPRRTIIISTVWTFLGQPDHKLKEVTTITKSHLSTW